MSYYITPRYDYWKEKYFTYIYIYIYKHINWHVGRIEIVSYDIWVAHKRVHTISSYIPVLYFCNYIVNYTFCLRSISATSRKSLRDISRTYTVPNRNTTFRTIPPTKLVFIKYKSYICYGVILECLQKKCFVRFISILFELGSHLPKKWSCSNKSDK